MLTIHNPVLRGFNPDPSILRVGDDYYIATSTFEWFPGVQIHHSRDLVHWRLLGRPLNRTSQLDIRGEHASCGVWAPCLSWDAGTFYLVYTDVKTNAIGIKDTHNYLVSAPSIEGPWSEPVYLHSHGFDPSLFHDTDGRKWLLCMETDFRKGRSRFAGIILQEWVPEAATALLQSPAPAGVPPSPAGRLVGPVHKIFPGTSLGLTEGPHLYRKDGWYYLLVAEGGTEYGHAATLARSRTITGPYEADPSGPVITSRNHPLDPLQKAGHACLVQAGNGDWYLAHLVGRPIARKGRCILGRETAIQQAVWTADGWLRSGPLAGRAATEVTVRGLAAHPWPQRPAREDFDGADLPIDFQTLRIPLGPDSLSLVERPGFLRLKGRETVGSRNCQALVARRQQAFRYRAATCLEFNPVHFKQSAGLICMYDHENFFYLRVSFDEVLGRSLDIMTAVNGTIDFPLSGPVALPAGRITLSVAVDWDQLRFAWWPESAAGTGAKAGGGQSGTKGDLAATADGRWPAWAHSIGPAFDASILSDEHCREGRFTGAFVGLCCQDLTGGRHPADFDWFEYRELPDENDGTC